MARDVAAKLRGINDYDPNNFVAAATRLFTQMFDGQVPTYAASKLVMLANLLNQPRNAPVAGAVREEDVGAALTALRTFASSESSSAWETLGWRGGRDSARRVFVDEVRRHAFSLEALREALDRLDMAAEVADVEAAAAAGARPG